MTDPFGALPAPPAPTARRKRDWCDAAECVPDADCLPDVDCSPDCVPDCDCGGCDIFLLFGLALPALAHLLGGMLAHPRQVARMLPPAAACAGPGARLGLLAIRCYQRWATAWTPRCPHQVSCSAYGAEALARLGLVAGSRAAWRRIRTCGARRLAA